MGDELCSRSFSERDPYSELKEAHTWETIKNALIGAKDAVGIEIPGLPSDLGTIGDSAATAVLTATDSATGALEDLTGSIGDSPAT